jgi:uncharacterized protein (TIGR00288 family)
MTEARHGEEQVAVLIDAENVGLNSIEPLLDQVSNVGRIAIKRAYGDWSAKSGMKEQLERLGIEPVHHFHSTRSGKNASDIRLAIDAMDLMHSSPVDAFVIVSADTDFVPLARRLRAAGKIVIGAGHRAIVSDTLVKSCDRYIYLEEASKLTTVSPAEPEQGQQLADLVLRAVEASMDVQGEVPGSKLHQTMLRIDPSFDYKALGYRTFTQFLEQTQGIELSRSRVHGDVVARRRRSGPEESREASGTALGGNEWAEKLDAAWSARAPQPGGAISGSWAAGEAAKILGLPRLKGSQYPTLQSLLDSSQLLMSSWSRSGNTLVRK